MSTPPPCGLYRTSLALGDIPAGRLVYFHNHGNPGPGIYLPSGWHQNRAKFHENGMPIPNPAWADSLQLLKAEGFYRVERPFDCCEKKCRAYEQGSMVQLGYDGLGEPILFVPEWTGAGFVLPEKGSRISRDRMEQLTALKVPGTSAGADPQVH